MDNPSDSASNCPSDSLQALLAEQDRLRQQIKEKYRKQVAIFFSDICGYTAFTDNKGDISSMAMLQKHNGILSPILETHRGTLIKTIGDAAMVSFAEPANAVKAARDFQLALEKYNRNADQAIEVKIGINTGEVISDGQDLFGDAVNIAARIQSQAQANEILISHTTFEQIRQDPELTCIWHGNARVKGKAAPLKLFRVIWREHDKSAVKPGQVRSMAAASDSKRLRFIDLTIKRDGNNIDISADECVGDEEITLRSYEKHAVDMAAAEKQAAAMIQILNRFNREGGEAKHVYDRMAGIGNGLFKNFFPEAVQGFLRDTAIVYLKLHINDQLVHLPWEFFHDGDRFLCQKFSMGRLVTTRQARSRSAARQIRMPVKMLALSNPHGNLAGTQIEMMRLQEVADAHSENICISFLPQDEGLDEVKDRFHDFDIVHFAGHAAYDAQHPTQSAMVLANGELNADQVAQIGKSGTMPALIFSNACHSAQTAEWQIDPGIHSQIFGLANAFLLAGVKHYAGSFWEVQDQAGADFANAFYRQLAFGNAIGDAMRTARQQMVAGENSLAWAGYVLYGDPTTRYIEDNHAISEVIDPTSSTMQPPDSVFSSPILMQRLASPKLKWIGICLAIVLPLLYWAYHRHYQKTTLAYQDQARTNYQNGRFEDALALCDLIQERDAGNWQASLLKGNMLLLTGDLQGAENAFQSGLNRVEDQPEFSRPFVMGLGRVESAKGQGEKALGWYQKIAATDANAPQARIAEAAILSRRQDYDDAARALAAIQGTSNLDASTKAFIRQTRDLGELQADLSHKARIDQLVRALLAQKAQQPAAEMDTWTSRPLLIWLTDLEVNGYALQEGEEELVLAGLIERFIAHPLYRVVERDLMEAILDELKLGSSHLADKSAKLRLGRILAANLIMTGHLDYMGPSKQVLVRVIETETSEIKLSLSVEAPALAAPDKLVTGVFGQITDKLSALYPMRGKITKIDGEVITLNIGSQVGVEKGQTFLTTDHRGIVEIVQVQEATSLAKILQGKNFIMEKQKVVGR